MRKKGLQEERKGFRGSGAGLLLPLLPNRRQRKGSSAGVLPCPPLGGKGRAAVQGCCPAPQSEAKEGQQCRGAALPPNPKLCTLLGSSSSSPCQAQTLWA